MPDRIIQAKQRIIVARLTLDILRSFGTGYFQSKRYGSRADDLALCAALFIGQAEGRPLTAAKLATYAGQARPSVVRRLKEWLQAGFVERQGQGYVLALTVINGSDVVRAAKSAQKRLRSAAKALDALDAPKFPASGPARN